MNEILLGLLVGFAVFILYGLVRFENQWGKKILDDTKKTNTEISLIARRYEDVSDSLNQLNDGLTKVGKLENLANRNQNLQRDNMLLLKRQQEYRQFFGLILAVLKEDTRFLRLDLVKRFGVDIPEMKELNSQIIEFQRKLEAIKVTLTEYSMIDDMEGDVAPPTTDEETPVEKE